jgi:hypothetical protein
MWLQSVTQTEKYPEKSIKILERLNYILRNNEAKAKKESEDFVG